MPEKKTKKKKVLLPEDMLIYPLPIPFEKYPKSAEGNRKTKN